MLIDPKLIPPSFPLVSKRFSISEYRSVSDGGASLSRSQNSSNCTYTRSGCTVREKTFYSRSYSNG
jgi:hypothetical protein